MSAYLIHRLLTKWSSSHRYINLSRGVPVYVYGVCVVCVCVRKREFCHRHRCAGNCPSPSHDGVKWKHFPRYWPFVRGVDRSPVNSLNKNKCRGALVFSLIYSWTNSWLNKQKDAGDLRRHVMRNLQWLHWYDIGPFLSLSLNSSSVFRADGVNPNGRYLAKSWGAPFTKWINVYPSKAK